MHVVVLGAGVVGATTAYSLTSRGHSVTIIDRAADAGAGSTHANGGQLSWSFTDSLARPSFLSSLPRLLLGRDPASRVRFTSEPPLFRWGLAFLRQCTPSRARDNTVFLLQAAMRSAAVLDAMHKRTGIRFAYRRSGKLVLLPPGASLRAARRVQELKRQHGCETRVLSAGEARAREPALAEYRGRYSAAVYAAGDALGDARAFTIGLIEWLVRQQGATFRSAETVSSLRIDNGRVIGTRSDKGDVAADAVVVCLGAWSAPLLANAGVRTCIYPVRGYSVTLPRGASAPSMSITDLARRLLICPLDGRIRISGFADFTGFDDSRDEERVAKLVETARRAAPDAADYAVQQCEPWAGSRPMRPDGRPLVGASHIPGLYLNCGHGMLGWTLACATAEDVAEAVSRCA